MITNGSVKYTLPAAYAENRPGSEVTLCFAVPDGSELTYAESFLAYTADQARNMAYKLQRGEPVVTEQPHTVAGPAIAEQPETAAAKGRRTRAAAAKAPTPGPTLAEAAASLVEAAQSLPGPVPATATAVMPVTVVSPLPVVAGDVSSNVVPLTPAAGPSTPPVTAGVPAATPTVPVAGPTSVVETALPTGAIAQVISDETLGQKVTAKLTEMRDILGVAQDVAVAKIHAAIQQFTGQPQGRLVDIAAEQRGAFITTLTALA